MSNPRGHLDSGVGIRGVQAHEVAGAWRVLGVDEDALVVGMAG
jgi:hypothetical protein